MPTLKFKRATVSQNDNYIGEPGEIVVLTDDNYRAVVHDGTTSGGYPLALESELTNPSIPNSALTEDLEAWWRFEDGDARDYTATLNATFADSTAYDGTINGATHQTSGGVTDFDNGTGSGNFDFDGTDDEIGNTGLTFSSGTITAMGWLNLDSGTNQYLICNQSSTSDGFILYNNNDGNARVLMRDDTGSAELVDGDPISSGSWTHLGFSWDGSTLELFKDGLSQGTVSLSTHTFSNQDIVIGYDPANNSNYINGQTDDCRIYERALTETEFNDIYTETQP